MPAKQQPQKPHLLDPEARQRALEAVEQQRKEHQAEVLRLAQDRVSQRAEALKGQR